MCPTGSTKAQGQREQAPLPQKQQQQEQQYQQQLQRQGEQLKEELERIAEEEEANRLKEKDLERSSDGEVTRVVGDILVFAKVVDANGHLLGLAFKPDRIVNYRGERLHSLGIVEGAHLGSIVWDQETRQVHAVSLEGSGGEQLGEG